jgi:hypothetical protein
MAIICRTSRRISRYFFCPELHERAQAALGFGPEDQHPSDQPARLDEQLLWLRRAGFDHVDCFWKWFELAVFAGTKPDETA